MILGHLVPAGTGFRAHLDAEVRIHPEALEALAEKGPAYARYRREEGARTMNSEEIVRERYPDAEAQHHEAAYQMGQGASTQPEYWAIYPARGLGHQPIATGPTEEAAWTLAADKVLEQLP